MLHTGCIRRSDNQVATAQQQVPASRLHTLVPPGNQPKYPLGIYPQMRSTRSPPKKPPRGTMKVFARVGAQMPCLAFPLGTESEGPVCARSGAIWGPKCFLIGGRFQVGGGHRACKAYTHHLRGIPPTQKKIGRFRANLEIPHLDFSGLSTTNDNNNTQPPPWAPRGVICVSSTPTPPYLPSTPLNWTLQISPKS